MSDSKPPTQPPIKDAVPDGKGDAPPPHKQLTFSQQLFIWTMVAIVGVIFGVGASFSLVFAPTVKVLGVAEGEAVQRRQVADSLERVLNPGGRFPEFNRNSHYDKSMDAYAADLRMARLGETRNLLPKGQALDRIEQEFLATPMPGGSGRTYLDALREHTGGTDEVRRDDLRRYLAERAARENLQFRSAVAPAVPRAIAPEISSLVGDRAEVAEILLSGARFVVEVKPDDPEIPALYERLRATAFRKPGGVVVALAVADRDELGKGLEISETDSKAWYDSNKDQFPGEADPKDPKKKPEPKPYEAVKEQVVAKLRASRGTTEAQKLIETLNANADVLEADKDPANFRTAVAAAKLKLVELTIEDREPGQIDLGALGKVKDVMRLFGREHEVGFLSQPVATSNGHWVMVRLEKRTEQGFQELEAVRGEVARTLAGRRAWKPLLEAAGKLRDELSAKGPGALAAWAAGEEAKPWQASLQNRPQALTMQFTTPPAEPPAPGVLPGEKLLLATLALAARPVALVAAEPAWEGDVPRVRLVQVGELKPGPREGLADRNYAEMFRGALGEYGESLFRKDFYEQLERP